MGYSTNRLVVGCCCLLKEVYSRFSCYRATGQAFFVGTLSTFQVFTQDVGEHRAGSSSGRTLPPLSDPLPLMWMHIWCWVHLVEICWHTIIQAFFKETKTTTTKKKNSCIERKMSEGCFARFAIRSPGVASFFFLSFFFFLPGLLLFSYSITLFHLTLPRSKGMQMQKGPIVFNCMHWRVAAQLKCFKCLCLCLKRAGGRSHRARPVQTSLHQVAPLMEDDRSWAGLEWGITAQVVWWTGGWDQAHRQGRFWQDVKTCRTSTLELHEETGQQVLEGQGHGTEGGGKETDGRLILPI